jgi:curved DNA-binding protein
MKYKDYYKVLGVARTAGADEIKKAYRKLAHKFHPDVSKEQNAKEKFQEIGEAYETLKNAEKRAAYDQLGSGFQAGQDFRPPPDWEQQFGDRFGHGGNGQASFDEADLADLFAGLSGRRRGSKFPMPGQDFEVAARITLEQATRGTELELNLNVVEHDEKGLPRRVPQTLRVRVPKGAIEGQRLRIPGKGGKGFDGGRDGDLYLNISLAPHRLFRASGHDLYVDLPLAPWEAVLGASVEVPTLDGAVRLKVPAGTKAGQQLRLAKRGLPKREGEGDLYAVVQITVPATPSARESELFQQLATESQYDPRSHFVGAKETA